MRGVVCTLDSQVSMLYHMTEAQGLGSWLMLEMTTMGRDIVWIHAHTHEKSDRNISTESQAPWCVLLTNISAMTIVYTMSF